MRNCGKNERNKYEDTCDEWLHVAAFQSRTMLPGLDSSPIMLPSSQRLSPIHLVRIHIDEVENGITLGNVEVAMYHLGFLRLEGDFRWRLATTNEDANLEPIILQSSKTSECK